MKAGKRALYEKALEVTADITGEIAEQLQAGKGSISGLRAFVEGRSKTLIELLEAIEVLEEANGKPVVRHATSF